MTWMFKICHLILWWEFPTNLWSSSIIFSFYRWGNRAPVKLREVDQAVAQEWTLHGVWFQASNVSHWSSQSVLFFICLFQDHRTDLMTETATPGVFSTLSSLWTQEGSHSPSISFIFLGFSPGTGPVRVAWPVSQSDHHPASFPFFVFFQWITYLYRDLWKILKSGVNPTASIQGKRSKILYKDLHVITWMDIILQPCIYDHFTLKHSGKCPLTWMLKGKQEASQMKLRIFVVYLLMIKQKTL